MAILVTGANGFVGSALCDLLERQDMDYIRVVRKESIQCRQQERVFDFSEPHDEKSWGDLVAGAETIIHLAAVAHQAIGNDESSRLKYAQVNVSASCNLLRQAINLGVKKFVFLSSVKAASNSSLQDPSGSPIRMSTAQPEQPSDIYGSSKLAAEKELQLLASNAAISLIILRPPLIYGSGQKGNMKKLFQFIDRGVPLPFSGIKNQRSLISVDNLCDALLHLVSANGKSGTYFLADIDVSTPELVRAIAAAFGKRPRMFYCSPKLLTLAASILGKTDVAERLLGSLTVDSRDFKEEFSWTPVHDFNQVLKRIARDAERSDI